MTLMILSLRTYCISKRLCFCWCLNTTVECKSTREKPLSLTKQHSTLSCFHLAPHPQKAVYGSTSSWYSQWYASELDARNWNWATELVVFFLAFPGSPTLQQVCVTSIYIFWGQPFFYLDGNLETGEQCHAKLSQCLLSIDFSSPRPRPPNDEANIRDDAWDQRPKQPQTKNAIFSEAKQPKSPRVWVKTRYPSEWASKNKAFEKDLLEVETIRKKKVPWVWCTAW